VVHSRHLSSRRERQITRDPEPAQVRQEVGAYLDEFCPNFTPAEYEISPCIQLTLDASTAVFAIDWVDNDGRPNGALWKLDGNVWTFKRNFSGAHERQFD
jgi:hypothetical protein